VTERGVTLLRDDIAPAKHISRQKGLFNNIGLSPATGERTCRFEGILLRVFS